MAVWAAAISFGFVSGASAAVIEYYGSDCSGVFGQGFESCRSPTGSPIIIKFNADGSIDDFNT